MDVWTFVVFKWVKQCNFVERQLVSLCDADLETFFCSYVKYVGTKWTIKSKSAGALRDFLHEAYDKFEINSDPKGLIIDADYVYAYTLLIHFVYARNPNFKLYERVRNKLPTLVQKYLSEFLYRCVDVELTRENVDQLVIDIHFKIGSESSMEQLSVLSHIDESVVNNGSPIKEQATVSQLRQKLQDAEENMQIVAIKSSELSLKIAIKLAEIMQREEELENAEYCCDKAQELIKLLQIDKEKAQHKIIDKQINENEDKGGKTQSLAQKYIMQRKRDLENAEYQCGNAQELIKLLWIDKEEAQQKIVDKKDNGTQTVLHIPPT